MSWKLPTIPEVLTSIGCVLTGHFWEYGVCVNCGAKKE